MMEKITKKLWKQAFVRFKENTAHALNKRSVISDEDCGYCSHYDPHNNADCGACPMISRIGNCWYDCSTFQKWLNETRKDWPRWKLVLRWSRQILQAIIDDGRKHGYVGKKEEAIIKELF
jgi:hypothetical protein